ncbi:class II aldolase/adducin N-terminal [Pterulicium gracile]|uniref:Class II aldolase/adducin N-terminal n=1 Tax=Pterulicium gracile TaxID=1884261 RepID=A0A5C3QM21_9AGAR|nr:class II aldolase/adducin N-terminal [Pterula gracilis]
MSPALTLSEHSKNTCSKSEQTPRHDTNSLSKNPLRRTWRGNVEGTVELAVIPKFQDRYAEREWVKAHLAAAFRFWGKQGFGDGVSGHITVKDPVLPDHYWMNPFAVHFSSMTKSKLVLVSPEGYVTPHGAQLPINTAGFHIHSAIHKARPDVVAAAHCHSLHGKAWSTFGRCIDIMTQDACLFYDNLKVYSNFGGIVLAPQEGENIARALGAKAKACILQNHGLLTVGSTVDEAVFLFSALDRLCHVQLLVEAAAANGIPKTVIDDEDAAFTANTLQWWENTYINFQPEYELLLEETNGAFLK